MVFRLAARMAEQAVKDEISLGMPDWKKIQTGDSVNISVDAQNVYLNERSQLQSWLAARDINKIIARYPIRETMALDRIASALQFKNRTQYETAVRKLVIDNSTIKSLLIGYFGNLPTAIVG